MQHADPTCEFHPDAASLVSDAPCPECNAPLGNRYRKKPVEIEALRFDGTELSAAVIMQWALDARIEYEPFLADRFKGDPKVYVAHPDPFLRIHTLEGVMIASAGDYVIKGVKGEVYPCKPDIFEATYELVSGKDLTSA